MLWHYNVGHLLQTVPAQLDYPISRWSSWKDRWPQWNVPWHAWKGIWVKHLKPFISEPRKPRFWGQLSHQVMRQFSTKSLCSNLMWSLISAWSLLPTPFSRSTGLLLGTPPMGGMENSFTRQGECEQMSSSRCFLFEGAAAMGWTSCSGYMD